MLLFADGFEHFHPNDLWRKWGHTYFGNPTQIVFGNNDSTGKPWARKSGRSLYLKGERNRPLGNEWGTYFYGVTHQSRFELGTPIRKSRTVYCGFALSSLSSDGFAVELRFYSRNFPKKYPEHVLEFGESYSSAINPKNLVARCYGIIRSDRVDYSWAFPDGNIDSQFGQIDAHTNLLSGDFYYYQTGITIHGNNEEGAAAWVENRIGQRNKTCKIENIYTATPNSQDSWYIDFVEIRIGDQPVCIDDVYICNDEGSTNNSFLGSTIVRSVGISGEGSENNSESFGGGYYRCDNVSVSGIVNTKENMPSEIPDPDADPLFLSWQDPRDSRIELSLLNDKQLFRTHAINYSGSEPFFFGAISHAMVRAPYPNNGLTTLYPAMKTIGIDMKGHNLLRPIEGFEDGRWELRSFVFENEENLIDGQKSAYWNPTALNNSEFGFWLGKVPLDNDTDRYNPSVLRLKYIFEEAPTESLHFEDGPQRFWEERMEEYFVVGSLSSYQYVFALYENLAFEDWSTMARTCTKWLNSVLICSEIIPWIYFWIHDTIEFTEKSPIAFLQVLKDSLAVDSYAYGFWVEMFEDGFVFVDNHIFAKGITAFDNMAFVDNSQTNHVLVNEQLTMTSSYIFSGHEFVGEYLYPAVTTPAWGWKMDVEEDTLVFDPEHFDGHWVEQSQLQFSIGDSVLTAHWRHEWAFGIVIASYHLEPIEMECPEGRRTGEITSQYWQLTGYLCDPGEL
jgi:hypothetical protein